jgi:signal peptidase I
MDEPNYSFNKDEKKFEKVATVDSSVPKKEDGGLGEILRFAIIAILIVVPIRVFIAQPFIVSGTSMIPTFEDSEYIIVDQLSYRINEPARGDVVIFKYPKDTSKYFIKRIIGLPGELVTISGTEVKITPADGSDSVILNESYIKNEGVGDVAMTLESDEYFVLGDNRASSFDSRYWGPLNDKYIAGRAFLRLFPVSEIDFLPGKFEY